MMRSLLLSVGAALAAAETTLTITTGTQSGFFPCEGTQDSGLRVRTSPPGSELYCTGIEKARCPGVTIGPAGPRWV